jgi:hypothetical protein
MGKRTWLNNQLANEYLPAIAVLSDTEAGHASAAHLAAQLRQSWHDRNFTTLSQIQPLFDETRVQLKAKFGADHFSLRYFGFTTAEYTELNNQKLQRTADRNEAVKQIQQPDAIVAKAVELLGKREWAEVVAGLAVLTGRRSSELLSTAKFEKASQWSVTFTGALKRGGESQLLSFEIPTLTVADRVIAALAKVRHELPDATQLPAQEVNRRYGEKVAQACDRHFSGLVPPRAGDNLYTHLFRAVYATIATFWYCPPWVQETEYRAAIQGHYAVLDEQDPTLRRSLTASRHYADYEIADSVIALHGGKRKGIKLGYAGIQPIAVFQRHDAIPQAQSTSIIQSPQELAPMPQLPATESVASSAQQPSRTRTSRSTLWIWLEDKDLARQVLAHFGTDDKHEPQQDVIARWLRWSLEHLQAQQRAIETTPKSGEDPVEPVKLPEATAINATTHTSATGAGQEPSRPSHLDEKFEALMAMFEQFMQLQLNQTQPQLSHSQPAAAATPQRSTQLLSTAASAPLPTTISGDPAPATQPAQPTSRRYRTGQDDQMVHQAINAIFAHNNQPNLPHDLKWAITINGLKAFTSNQRAIERVINERQQEIEAHHAHHQLEPNHNHRHKRKRKLGELIQLKPTSSNSSTDNRSI